MNALENWLHNNRMKVSTDKSSLTLITPYNQEYNAQPHVTLNNIPIPIKSTTTILGVTYDKGLTFRPHVEAINSKAKRRLNVLRALSNTTFGHSKESITTIYKQFIRPILTYAHPSWNTDIAPTHTNTLQKTQNMALRVATGCTKTTPIDHLHEETLVLPLKHNMNMMGMQFYAGTVDPDHPCHQLQTPLQTRRHIHNTPAAHYSTLLSNIPPPPDNTSMRKHIHTTVTSQTLSSYRPNTILQDHPPQIADEERGLPRADRVHLSRLRCGHHPVLQSYQCRIGNSPTDTCLRCHGAPDSVRHVMAECPTIAPSRHTHGVSTVRDLWDRPVSCIAFLREADVLQ